VLWLANMVAWLAIWQRSNVSKTTAKHCRPQWPTVKLGLALRPKWVNLVSRHLVQVKQSSSNKRSKVYCSKVFSKPARQQYAGYTGAPMQSLQAPLAALGAAPVPPSTTKSENQDLFGLIQSGVGAYSALQKLCWVAREVYGEDDPKWLQFREWVIGYSPDWFYKAYSKYGENVAKVVAKVPALKLIIRPYMDAKRKAIGFK
jgi:hypothetical protein